jgi:hypothetical protein
LVVAPAPAVGIGESLYRLGRDIEPKMPTTSKRDKAKGDLKKAGRDVKKVGKDVEIAVEKGAHDVKKAGSKLKKKL